MKIAITGGGVAGLAAAHHLQKGGHQVTVFEAKDRVGGNIQTEIFEGCRIEWGPNGFLDNEPATLELVAELGLESRLVQARSDAAKRYIFRDGKLRELPAKPPQFVFNDCLPLKDRLRVILEPFAAKPPGRDESVHEFASRRIGRGAADVLVDAMVTGVYAGDSKRLSVRSAFPKLYNLEKNYGSLIKGSKGRGFGPKGTLTSFDEGLEVLIERLSRDLEIRYRESLTGIPKGFDHVVCALPAPRAADVLGGEMGDVLRRIPTAPVVVVALLFEEDAATREAGVPDAFGFLVPRDQGMRILGTLYDSSIFPGRAPEGTRLFRTLLGGRRDPEVLECSDDQILEIVARDLERAWGHFPKPRSVRVIRHPLGIAQYEIGHAEILADLAAVTPENLSFLGSSYNGVAINGCIKSARDWAREFVSRGGETGTV